MMVKYTPHKRYWPPLSWRLPIWILVGNANDGYPPGFWPKIKWFLTNPFHNFCFFIIGFANYVNWSVGRDPRTPFVEGWNWAFTAPMPFPAIFPFISHKGKTWKWYAGWRCPDGAFGFKFRRV